MQVFERAYSTQDIIYAFNQCFFVTSTIFSSKLNAFDHLIKLYTRY